jgi:hypothetical protein
MKAFTPSIMTSRPSFAPLAAIVIGWFIAANIRAEPPSRPLRSSEWKRHTIDNSSLGADGVRSADVNADGLPDLVCGWEQGGVSRIYLMQRESAALYKNVSNSESLGYQVAREVVGNSNCQIRDRKATE